MEALRHSPALVTDPDDADVILVDDYCYKLRWLAYVHADGHPNLSSEADEAASAETVVGVRSRSRPARLKDAAAALFGLRGRTSPVGSDGEGSMDVLAGVHNHVYLIRPGQISKAQQQCCRGCSLNVQNGVTRLRRRGLQASGGSPPRPEQQAAVRGMAPPGLTAAAPRADLQAHHGRAALAAPQRQRLCILPGAHRLRARRGGRRVRGHPLQRVRARAALCQRARAALQVPGARPAAPAPALGRATATVPARKRAPPPSAPGSILPGAYIGSTHER